MKKTKRSTSLIALTAAVSVSVFLVPNGAKADINTGLVGRWTFNESSGTAVLDSSGNGINGTFVGTPIRATGISGNALYFAGTDVVRLPYSDLTDLGIKTTSVWVKAKDFLKDNETLFGFKGHGGSGGFCSDSYRAPYTYNLTGSFGSFKISYENSAGSLIRPGSLLAPYNTLKLGKWDHYATVYAASGENITITLYKNGVAVGTPYTASDGYSENRCALEIIGSQEDIQNVNYLRSFTGWMDDARLYNRALSASDVLELYNSYSYSPPADSTAPTVPAALTATKDATAPASRINLTWNASTDASGVTGYLVYRATAEGGPYTPMAYVTETSFSDVARTIDTTWYYTLAPGTQYFYKVAAVDEAYNISAQSGSASTTLDAAPSGTYTLTVNRSGSPLGTVTSSPSGISCGSTCTYTFDKETTVHLKGDLAATAPYGAFTGWSGAGCTNAAICTIHMDSDKTITAYYGGSPPQTYQCSDGSDNDSDGLTDYPADPGCSSSSDDDEYNVPPADSQAPTVPAGLSATAISSNQINLSWTASTDNVAVTGYRIYRGGAQIGTTANTSYSDTGLSPETAYTYTVAAYDAVPNVSAQSSPASATTQASVGSGGLVGWWKLDEGTGTVAADSSGRGHDGTLVNGPTWVAGRIGSGALSFNGSSTYVNIPASPDFNVYDEFSVSAWVYSTNSTRVTAVGRAVNNLWHLWVLEQINTGTGTARFDMEYVTRDEVGDLAHRAVGPGYSLNTWHHVVGVKSAGDDIVRIYVDTVAGANSSAVTEADPTDLDNVPITIGARRNTPDEVWNGYIDDVRFYDRAISLAEITALYNETSDTNPPASPAGLIVS